MPLAGTTAVNHTSSPLYVEHVGSINPKVPVASTVVYCVKVQVKPTVRDVAEQGSSLIGGANSFSEDARSVGTIIIKAIITEINFKAMKRWKKLSIVSL